MVGVELVEQLVDLLASHFLALSLENEKLHTWRNSGKSREPWVSTDTVAIKADTSSLVRSTPWL